MKIGILLALVSSLLTASSFYRFDFLIFFSLIPFFIVCYRLNNNQRLITGFIWGLIFASILCFWIAKVSILGFILVAVYLGLYPGVFFLLAFAKNFSPLLVSLIWVVLEYIRSFFLGGFPFGFLGYALYKRLSLIQIADIFEVYGVSFLIVFVNSCIAYLFISRKLRLKLLNLCLMGVLLVSSYWYGNNQLNKLHCDSYLSGVALAQTNVDSCLKWEGRYYSQHFLKFKYLYLMAKYKSAKLVIFPETIFPFLWNQDKRMEKDIITVILDVKLPVIIGLPYKKGDRYYNASLFFDHNGEIKGIYFKRHLVPFGEYVPLKKLFFWIEKIYPIANYAPGKKCGVFEFNGVKFGVLICFEIMFPNLVKDAVKNGAEFIVNQSDEGWFPNSAEIYLTHQIAVFRAIEARRTIVRVTNTGLTSVIDFTGKSIYNLDPYKADLLVISIPVRNRDK